MNQPCSRNGQAHSFLLPGNIPGKLAANGMGGPAGEALVSCQRRSGLVTADATIAFAQAPLVIGIAFLESGEIAGLRLLPQPERAAQPGSGPGQPG